MTKRLLPFHRWPNSAACSSLQRVRPSAAWSTTTVLPSRSRVALSVLPLSKNTPSPSTTLFALVPARRGPRPAHPPPQRARHHGDPNPTKRKSPPPSQQSDTHRYLSSSEQQSTHISLRPIFFFLNDIPFIPIAVKAGQSSCEVKPFQGLHLCLYVCKPATMPCHNLFCKTNTSQWLQHISETLHQCVPVVAVQTPMVGWNVKIVKMVLSSQQRAGCSKAGGG